MTRASISNLARSPSVTYYSNEATLKFLILFTFTSGDLRTMFTSGWHYEFAKSG